MNSTKLLQAISQSPGVYIYKNSEGTVLYVGKAVNLKRRVHQYFQRTAARTPKITQLVSEVDAIETIETLSEFDALFLEAKLIRAYQPKYNSIAKDDKSPLYVALTLHEELPRIVFLRKRQLETEDTTLSRHDPVFGPFQSSRVVRTVLKMLRHSISYCTSAKRDGTPCFYTHIGLCSPCASLISKMPGGDERKILVSAYRRNMFRLRDILSGKASPAIDAMVTDMNTLASENKYEQAARMRNQIQSLYELLKKRLDPSFYMTGGEVVDLEAKAETDELIAVLRNDFPNLHTLSRIECFDISNTMGEQPSASMVVLSDGRIDNREYRKFRIRLQNGPNDFAMMQEVLTRRLSHPEWPYPNLIVVDGGKGQVSAAGATLREHNVDIPLIGLAKRQEEIVIAKDDKSYRVIRIPLTSGAMHLLERIRDEAHRFALSYHRLLRGKHMIP